MRINDHIFFSPETLLKDLNLDDKSLLIDAFESRVTNYYLRPIKSLNKMRYAFPAAIIEFSMIDALARYSTDIESVGERIKEMIKNDFNTSAEIAKKAYEDFRNGLLHENHIKNSGQLCYETDKSFLLIDKCLLVNPLKLQRELDDYLNCFIEKLRVDDSQYSVFLRRVRLDFEKEIVYFKKMN